LILNKVFYFRNLIFISVSK